MLFAQKSRGLIIFLFLVSLCVRSWLERLLVLDRPPFLFFRERGYYRYPSLLFFVGGKRATKQTRRVWIYDVPPFMRCWVVVVVLVVAVYYTLYILYIFLFFFTSLSFVYSSRHASHGRRVMQAVGMALSRVEWWCESIQSFTRHTPRSSVSLPLFLFIILNGD